MKNNKISLVIQYVLLFVVVILITFISLGGFSRNYDAYEFLDGNDGTATEMIIKSIKDLGLKGYYFNSYLGAPDSASYIDASGLDIISVIVICVLSIGGNLSAARIYYYLLYFTFICTTFAMVYLMRKLDYPRILSFVFGLLFSFAPFHMYRYLVHISLGNAFSIPLIIMFSFYIIGIISCESKKDKLIWCILGLLIGLGNAYYVFFGMILMFLAYIYSCIKDNSLLKPIKKMWVIIPCLVGMFVTRLPQLIYHIINGSNKVAFVREYTEQELYGLRIIQMLLPVTYSRIPFLKNITSQYYDMQYIDQSESFMSSLGLVASIGFIILCVVFIFSFINRDRIEEDNKDYIIYSCLATLTIILTGSMGGFGAIFNMLVTPQFRCYNRVSVVITCFSLLILAFFLKKIWTKKENISIIICLVVFLLGMFDSLYIYDEGSLYSINLKHEIYQEFFDRAEAFLPQDSMIYQLPYADYPEADDIYDFYVSKHFIGYLFTDNFKYSYGGIIGRDNSAKRLYFNGGADAYFISSIKEAGFNAVYIDCTGFEDGGANIVNYYINLNMPYITSLDGKIFIFDISDYNEDVSYDLESKSCIFVKNWMEKYAGVSSGEYVIAGLANGLLNYDIDTYKNLYSYIYDKDVVLNGTNYEYVEFLFSEIFGAVPDKGQIEYWASYLDNNYTRESMFELFISSEDFIKMIM